MPYTVTQGDVLSVGTDIAVVCIENTMLLSEEPISQRLGEAGGEAFQAALRRKRFLSVGRAWACEPCGLPFRHLLAVGTPQWRMGESNELLVLRLCYEALYDEARRLGCRSLATPFLSAAYYLFPQEDAVRVAREEAAKSEIETVFLAATEELYALAKQPIRKPEIVSYLGYYRDHAVFTLDNGQYARVDLRPELRIVNIRPYVEPCYYNEADPSYPRLAASEIARLRAIYDEVETI